MSPQCFRIDLHGFVLTTTPVRFGITHDMSEEIPKMFISYSWSSPGHEQWVVNLATELRESGIDVILDKWDLKEGHDAHAFMEKMVADLGIKKVAIVCDRIYVEKANSRSGGVGTETQIISPEIYEKQDQNKFVAIVSEQDDQGKPSLPIYYKSRIYIDLSDNDLYAKNFEQLLRWAYDKPLHISQKLARSLYSYQKQKQQVSEQQPYFDERLMPYEIIRTMPKEQSVSTSTHLSRIWSAFALAMRKGNSMTRW